MLIRIDIEKCTGCGTCLNVCPFGAIIIKEYKAFITEACTLCGACVESCPESAIIDERGKEEAKQATMEDMQDSKFKVQGVWVFAEQSQGKIASVAYELLGIGRKLAEELKSNFLRSFSDHQMKFRSLLNGEQTKFTMLMLLNMLTWMMNYMPELL